MSGNKNSGGHNRKYLGLPDWRDGKAYHKALRARQKAQGIKLPLTEEQRALLKYTNWLLPYAEDCGHKTSIPNYS